MEYSAKDEKIAKLKRLMRRGQLFMTGGQVGKFSKRGLVDIRIAINNLQNPGQWNWPAWEKLGHKSPI